MIGTRITRHLNEDETIEIVDLVVTKDIEVLRKLQIKIGGEFVVKPLNPRKKKHRDRRVIIRKFLESNYGLTVQVQFIDNKRIGKVEIDDLDIIE